jgi:hypothetical protein
MQASNRASAQLQALYQRPNDLEFAVFSGELPVQLTILAQETLVSGDWQFLFHIIGESHFVTIKHKGKPILHEVLACMRLPVAKCEHHHRFPKLRPHHYTWEQYTASVTFESNTTPKMSLTDRKIDLELAFPAIFGQTPVTQIGWGKSANTLTWWTTHLYPEQDDLITVQTFSKFKYG